MGSRSERQDDVLRRELDTEGSAAGAAFDGMPKLASAHADRAGLVVRVGGQVERMHDSERFGRVSAHKKPATSADRSGRSRDSGRLVLRLDID